MKAAQCNATSAETPIGFSIEISSATNNTGIICELIVTTAAIYLSMETGERVKILDSSIAWAIDYGEKGTSMALYTDSSFLIAGASFNTSFAYLGKLNSSDGTVMASFSLSAVNYYSYIYS